MLKTEANSLIALAWPLLIAQITQILMGVSDTIMAGNYTATDMAAVAVGFSIINPIQFFIQGLALALPPIVARLQGAKADSRIAFASQQVGYVLLVATTVFLSLSVFIKDAVHIIPMADELRPITGEYVLYMFFAIPGFAMYQWLRNYSEGLGLTKPTMVITLIGLSINIAANYVLIYGKFGLPEMGGAGCGLATALVFYGMLIVNVLYVRKAKKLQPYGLFKRLYKPDMQTMLSSVKLGLPIAMTILFEVSLFAVVAILLAPLGTTQVAAHQIALNVSSLLFMFPMSIGMAVAIRIGYRIGENNIVAARYAAKAAMIVGLSIALFTAIITVLGRDVIVLAYTREAQVTALAIHLLLFAAVFQFSDAIQVISANSLRGYKDTTAMFLITFVAYWLIGLPVGVTLGTTDWLTEAPMNASGFWIGFISGLSAAAVMLGIRLNITQKRLERSTTN